MPFQKRVTNRRGLVVEPLEERRLLSATPHGALPHDTAEYLLGRVAVTPVFLESDGSIDESTEDWTASQIDATLGKIDEALDWWVDTLASLNSVHELEFVVDTSFAADPFETSYEGINRISDDYEYYVTEFLAAQGHDRGPLPDRARDFNHAQRLKLDTDWSLSLFVVNSAVDEDGAFASGGSFSRAFAFAGGLFYVVPSERPASTYAHELGHIFYALDEYTGAASYSEQRGYYSTENLNAADNPAPDFQQQPSIMSSGVYLADAYQNHVSPPSTLAMVGWQDSDGDGIFDVLDNPVALDGVGRYDPLEGVFEFTGTAAVTTLANKNPWGLQSDITLGTVSSIEYRLDGGDWMTLLEPDQAVVPLDIELPLDGPVGELQLRAIDRSTGIASQPLSFAGSIPAAAVPTGVVGHVRWERNGNGIWDGGDVGATSFEIQIRAADGSPLPFAGGLEPDDLASADLRTQPVEGVSLESVGDRATGGVAALPTEASASTGAKTFWADDAFAGDWVEEWGDRETVQLKATFDELTTVARIDVIGADDGSVGRLSAFRADGTLLERVTSGPLAAGQVETLSVASSAGEIAYILAGGHGRTKVRLDHLSYGTPDTTLVDEYGIFALPHLPEGDYLGRVIPWSADFVSIGASESEFSVVAGEPANLQFAFAASRNPWQNASDPLDVSGDGSITPVDALQVINEINRSGPRPLLAADAGERYFDVDGNYQIGPLDALKVINALNQVQSAFEGEAVSGATASLAPPLPSDDDDPLGGEQRRFDPEAASPDLDPGTQLLVGNGEFVPDMAENPKMQQQAAEKSENSEESSSRFAAIDDFFSEPFHV